MFCTMIKIASRSVALAVAAAVAGCSSEGLSVRETGMQTYSNMLYATPEAVPSTGPVTIDMPARIGVVQIGEIAPPEAMLKAFRSKRELFQSVSPQSGIIKDEDVSGHRHLDQMRELAGNLGAEYLLIFGGNIDSGCQETGLSIVNLTIVGCFIIPSTAVHVDGKSAGSLVDVRSGRVVMNFSSETGGTGMTPTAFAQNTQTASVATAKSKLTQQLTDDVIRQMTEQRQSVR